MNHFYLFIIFVFCPWYFTVRAHWVTVIKLSNILTMFKNSNIYVYCKILILTFMCQIHVIQSKLWHTPNILLEVYSNLPTFVDCTHVKHHL